MATSMISVVVLLFVAAGQLRIVFSSGSTIIKSNSEWTSVEGSNFTLGCWVSQSNSGIDADTLCRTRIRFTRNSTIIAEDPRHVRSGTIRDGQTNRINCTMIIFRLQSEDSGLYGCCWPNAEGNCSRHPTRMLKVLPAIILAPTSTTVSTSSSGQTTSSRTPSESNAVVYQSISMRSVPTSSGSSGGENEALKKRSGSSIHKTIWPLLLVIAVLVIIIIFRKRYMKRKSADGHSIPSGDQETHGHLSQSHDSSSAYDMDGVLATTTTTTTTTVLNRTPDDDSER